jgi:fructosamine-3-kinase
MTLFLQLPRSVAEGVIDALGAAGDAAPVRKLQPIRGGYESHSYKLTTRTGSYFLKWSDKVRPGRYSAEARGLALLRETGTVRVPVVLGLADTRERDEPDTRGGATDGPGQGGAGTRLPGFVLMEWLDRPPNEIYLRRAGPGLARQVAALHRCERFLGQQVPGYRRDHGLAQGWGERTGAASGAGASTVPAGSARVGADAQAGNLADAQATAWRVDGWATNWIDAFREQFLRPRIEEAEQKGRLTPERRRRLERVLERLGELLGGVERQPSLLHGDLHRGNVLCDRAGAPALVDPNPAFGDRELELAYTEWMSGLPPVFYGAYFEAWPAAEGRLERRDMYLLWLMLGELNRGDPRRAMPLDALVHRYAGS